MPQESTGNKLIVKNASMLYLRMFFTMVLGFYSSRIVLKALGVSDYGLFAVVGVLIVVINILVGALRASTSRFITFSLGNNDLERQKIVFSTSFIIHLIFAFFFLVVAESIGLWIVNNYLNIPSGRENAASWVYQASVLSTFFGITQTPYNASISAHEHFDMFAYIHIFESVAKLAIAFIVLYSSYDHLILYSILYVLISIIAMFFYRVYCIRKFEECHLVFKFDKILFKKMFVFSSWELIGNVSFNLYSQGQNIFVNRFLGTIVNAAVGVAGQVQSLLYMFFSNVTTAFRPQIIKETAAGNYSRAISLVEMGTKFTTLLAIISTVPFFFHLEFLMSIWLEEVPKGAVPICQIFLIANFLNSFNPFVYIAIQATGKNRKINVNMSIVYAIVLLIMYIIISKYKSFVFFYMCGLIIPPISNFLYLLSLRKHMHSFSARRFLMKVYVPFFFLFCVCMVTSWGGRFVTHSPLVSFIISIIIVVTISSSFSFCVILDSNERNVLKDSMNKIVNSFKKSNF